MNNATSGDGEVEPLITEEIIAQQRNRPWKYIPQFSDEECRMLRVERKEGEGEGEEEDREEGEGLLQYYRHNRTLEAEFNHDDDDLNGDLEVEELTKVVYGKPPPTHADVEEGDGEGEVHEEPIVPVRLARQTETEAPGVEEPACGNGQTSDDAWRSVEESLLETEQHLWEVYATPHTFGDQPPLVDRKEIPDPAVTSFPMKFDDHFVEFLAAGREQETSAGFDDLGRGHEGHRVFLSLETGENVPTETEVTPVRLEFGKERTEPGGVEPERFSDSVGVGGDKLVELERDEHREEVEEELLVEAKVSAQKCGFPPFSWSAEEVEIRPKEEPNWKTPGTPGKDIGTNEETVNPGATATPRDGNPGEGGIHQTDHETLLDTGGVKVQPGRQGDTLPPLGPKNHQERSSRPQRSKSESVFGFLRIRSKSEVRDEGKGQPEERTDTTATVTPSKDGKTEEGRAKKSSQASFFQKLGFGRHSKKNDRHAKEEKTPEVVKVEKEERRAEEDAGKNGEPAKSATLPKTTSGKTNLRIFEIMAKNPEGDSTAPEVAKTHGNGMEAGEPPGKKHSTLPHPMPSDSRAGEAQFQVAFGVDSSTVGGSRTGAEEGNAPREVLLDAKPAAESGGAAQSTDDRLAAGAKLEMNSAAEAGPAYGGMNAKRKYIVAVAIDFGTAFSGYAFCFLRDPDSVHMMGRWEDGDPGVINQKTPTTLLLTPEGEFHSFGFTARNNYHDLSNDDAKEWLYFDRFKMALYETQDYSQSMTIEAANGKRFSGLAAISMTLRFFRDHALEQISSQSETRILNDDVLWIVTVPAIWNASAKQLMRLAAYKAELAIPERPDQLLVALEPEAASVHIRRLQLRHLVPEKPIVRPLSVREEHVDPAELECLVSEFNHVVRYMVVDCGGGTVDITVHEMNFLSNRLQELHVATGGPHGSFAIDRDFEGLLGDIFGRDFIHSYRLERPSGWIGLMMAFESRKRAADPRRTNPLNVALPFSFIEYHRKIRGKSVDESVRGYGDSGVRWSSQGMLRLSQEMMKKMFTTTLLKIREAIENVLGAVKDIEYIFLVGGLSESAVLQCDIREHFKNRVKKVVIPLDANLAVIKGAVAFGLDPGVISVRRSKLTYGAAVLNRFVPGKHPPSKLVEKEGIEWCRDVFDIFVRAGQVVRAGERVVRQYIPAAPSQKQIVIGIYSSEVPDPSYVSDPGVRKCAIVSLDLIADHVTGPGSSASGPTRRRIQTELVFAETEIKVTATDTTTGSQVNASIDFLNV